MSLIKVKATNYKYKLFQQDGEVKRNILKVELLTPIGEGMAANAIGTNIIMILDASGSMNESPKQSNQNSSSNREKTPIQSLKEAAKALVDMVSARQEQRGDSPIVDKISLIFFNESIVQNSGLTSIRTGRKTLDDTIDNATAYSRTYMLKALDEAISQFESTINAGDTNNNVMVVMTDGVVNDIECTTYEERNEHYRSRMEKLESLGVRTRCIPLLSEYSDRSDVYTFLNEIIDSEKRVLVVRDAVTDKGKSTEEKLAEAFEEIYNYGSNQIFSDVKITFRRFDYEQKQIFKSFDIVSIRHSSGDFSAEEITLDKKGSYMIDVMLSGEKHAFYFEFNSCLHSHMLPLLRERECLRPIAEMTIDYNNKLTGKRTNKLIEMKAEAVEDDRLIFWQPYTSIRTEESRNEELAKELNMRIADFMTTQTDKNLITTVLDAIKSQNGQRINAEEEKALLEYKNDLIRKNTMVCNSNNIEQKMAEMLKNTISVTLKKIEEILAAKCLKNVGEKDTIKNDIQEIESLMNKLRIGR